MTILYILHFSIINLSPTFIYKFLHSLTHLLSYPHPYTHPSIHLLITHYFIHPSIILLPILIFIYQYICSLHLFTTHPPTHPSSLLPTHRPTYAPPPHPSSQPVTHLFIYLSAGYLLDTNDSGTHFCWERQVSDINIIIVHLISSVKEIKQEDVIVGIIYFSSRDQVQLLRGGAQL